MIVVKTVEEIKPGDVFSGDGYTVYDVKTSDNTYFIIFTRRDGHEKEGIFRLGHELCTWIPDDEITLDN